MLANLSDANGPAGIEVLVGHGDGTFQSPKTVVTGQAQILLAVADLNHDNKADLVVGFGDLVQIMLGNGDGTFSMAGGASLQLGDTVDSALTADVNGDGIPDLIVGSLGAIHRCGISSCRASQTSVLLSTGSGNLQGEQPIAVYPPVAVGDFDGDGKIDVAIRVPSLIPALRKLSIYPGNGDGTFAQPISLPDPGFIAAFADVNGDQLTDFVLLDATANQLGVMLNSTPAFHMSASQSTLTLTTGGSVTDEISLTTVNGFSSAIQLSCAVNGPAPAPTCSLSPPDIPAGANSPMVTMTVTAPVQSHLTPLLAPAGKRSFYALGLVVALFGLIPGLKRPDRRSVRWVVGILLGSLLMAAIACGNSQPRVVPQNQYSVQVAAKSDTLSRTLQVSLTAP